MNIKEFASQYCSDIMAEAKRRSEMFDLSGFSYDEIIKEDDGTEVRVVNTANYQIPIIDILGMDLIIVEGEDALTAVRNMLSREQEKIAMYDNIPEAFR
mgnify:CR=1 FL=1